MKFIRLPVSLLVASLFMLFSSSVALALDPTLELTPSTNTVYEGQTFDVDVVLTSDGNSHSKTTFELTFDPSLLQVTNISDGFLYYNLLTNNFDNTLGTVFVEADFFGGSNTPSGTVATVTFSALAAGTSPISFTANTEILDNITTAFPGSVFTGSSATVNTPLTESALTLTSTYSDWAVGDQQEVIVSIDSQGNSLTGVDIVLNYDPALFSFVNTQWSNIFPNQQGFSVDSTNGIITVSGVSNQDALFNGSGEVISITFEALAIGSNNFSFDWTLGSTTDTNIVDSTTSNSDLLVSQPGALTISIINSASLSFEFGLIDYLGDITTKTGSLLVVGPDVTSNFSTPSVLGVISNHALGTFTYNTAYDIVLRIPGYLAVKQNQNVTTGVNPLIGNLDFGDLTPGDINQDDVNNTFDLYQIFNYWNSTSFPAADLNGDGKVNSFDVGLLYNFFNQTAAI